MNRLKWIVVASAVWCHAQCASAQLALPPTKVATAPPAAVRVLATAAVYEPLAAVARQAEAAAGRPIVIEYGSARGNLKSAILSGEGFDVAILLPDVNDDLRKAGKIRRDAFCLARIDVALGVRGDAPTIDVSTPEALKATLLNARSVVYSPTGAALPTVRKLLGDLGIAAAIRDSSTGGPAVALAPGEYEIGIYPLSEILANKSLRNLGPVLAPFQVPSLIQAVIGTRARHRAAVLRLVRFLQGPALAQPLADKGIRQDRECRP